MHEPVAFVASCGPRSCFCDGSDCMHAPIAFVANCGPQFVFLRRVELENELACAFKTTTVSHVPEMRSHHPLQFEGGISSETEPACMIRTGSERVGSVSFGVAHEWAEVEDFPPCSPFGEMARKNSSSSLQ